MSSLLSVEVDLYCNLLQIINIESHSLTEICVEVNQIRQK